MNEQKELLLCGGVVGHLMHLYDNRELTFAEIKDLLTSAADGSLESVTEKLDGINLVFSWDVSANDLRVARNSGNIKSGGLDEEAIASKFRDRGSIAVAFNTAFSILRAALESISNDVKVKIFGLNASTWYSMEIIYTENPNVINYDSNNIIFHGWPVFEIKNDVIAKVENSAGVDLLQANISRMQNAVKVRNWRIRGPAVLNLKGISDGTILQQTLASISSAQANADVTDSDTIDMYLHNLLAEKVANLGIPETSAIEVVARCLGDAGAPGLVQIKSKLPKEYHAKVSDFVKSSPKLLKEFVQPIEFAINKFAVEVLKGLKSTLIDDSDREILRLRSEVEKAIKAIEASGEDVAMNVLQAQMQKLENLENISSSTEGVVFIYKGNAYKFTGSFAPANQILGLFKYGRSGVKLQTSESKLKQYIQSVLRENHLYEIFKVNYTVYVAKDYT